MISDNMPEKIIEVEYVEMDDKHHKFYEEVKNGVKDDIDKVNLNSSNLLALTTRLRQASSAPGVLSSNSPDSSKILRCVDLVKELIEQNEKVVILANFKESVYDLARKLENYSPLISTGDQTEDQISKNIDKFQNDSKYKIFIGTHSRIGTGVTLNSAKHLICIDTP
jgi:SNF2 family DNA or RNA helicase